METKIVKVTDKGQISIPMSMQHATGIEKGDELIIISKGKTLIIEKIKESRFADLLKHSESVAEKLWSSKADDAWDTV